MIDIQKYLKFFVSALIIGTGLGLLIYFTVTNYKRLQKDNTIILARIDSAFINSPIEIRDSLISVFKVDRKSAMRFAVILKSNADRFHIDWKQIAAKIQVESHFDPFLVSKLTQIGRDKTAERAYGLMQLKPATAAGLAKQLDVSFGGISWLFNEDYNVYLGTYLFYAMLGKLNFSFEKAVKAYNAGLQGYKDGLSSDRHWHKVLYNYKLLNGEKDTLLYKIILAEDK